MCCIVLYFNKVIKGSTSMKDCTAKNGHVNAVLFTGTSKSDKVIDTMVDTKSTAIAAQGVTDQHVNGAEVELQIPVDCYPVTAVELGTAAAIDTAKMKGQGNLVV